MAELIKTKTPSVYYQKLKNDDISYIIKYKLGKNVKQENVGRKSSGMTESKAAEILRNIKYDIARNFRSATSKDELEIARKNKITSLKVMCEKYLADKDVEVSKEKDVDVKNKRYKTAINLRKDRNRLNFWLNNENFKKYINFPLSRITPEVIDKVILTAKKNNGEAYMPKSMKLNIDIMLTVTKHFNYPKSENPFLKIDKKLIPLKKEFKPRTRYLTLHECNTLFEVLKQKKNKRDYVICLICLLTGARPDSVIKLRIKDLYFSTNRINLFDFKRKMYYESIFNEECQRAVNEYLDGRIRNQNDYLFFHETTDKALSKFPASISRVLNQLFNFDQYGNKIQRERSVVPYTLRHSFASININEFKMPIYEVSRCLNHSSVNTTSSIYVTHDLEKSANYIDALSKGALGSLHNGFKID
ncbi:site-specific integrase [Sulfurospirillum diekertiae]|uniref:Site-specific integrase n=1 Tax=Sulfurospirillum diekertiae TaxID=1854492 RepID=A0A6G9VWX8_9BACT|nr:site-specific integrase [Sulfurospirillum diekertiae]QIR77184.1 site-specific integrase [Sulfurospirillum diekertiae]QIR79798.1 site-specific integrase [Sulfurospirillum diekertiae]